MVKSGPVKDSIKNVNWADYEKYLRGKGNVMGLIAAKCSQCGAALEVDDTKDVYICKYCGTAYIAKQEIHNNNIKNTYNIQHASINVQGANLDNLRILGDEAYEKASYPLSLECFKKADSYFARIIEVEFSTEYKYKHDICNLFMSIKSPTTTTSFVSELYVDYFQNIDGLDLTSVEKVNKISSAISKTINLIEAIEDNSYHKFISNRITYDRYYYELIGGFGNILICIESTFSYLDNECIKNNILAACKLGESTLVRTLSKYNVSDKSRYNPSKKRLEEIYENADKLIQYGCKVDPSYTICSELIRIPISGGSIYFKAMQVYGYLMGISKGFYRAGCYIATCVYGSYDCPEVCTLRRFRDYTLDRTWYGRLFILCYYAVSPTLVKILGKKNWFKAFSKSKLDKLVKHLKNNGINDTYYNDKY